MPKRVLIIGLLFCLAGLRAIYEMVAAVGGERIVLNFGFLMLPIGIGLLKGKAVARSWAHACVIFGYIGCAIVFLLLLVAPENAKFNFFSREITGNAVTPLGVCFVLIAGGFLYALRRLLYSPKATAYFTR